MDSGLDLEPDAATKQLGEQEAAKLAAAAASGSGSNKQKFPSCTLSKCLFCVCVPWNVSG